LILQSDDELLGKSDKVAGIKIRSPEEFLEEVK
jgi:hypothetical protein